MMCELPSNAVIADAFLDYFDSFSSGSNDMTQLTLAHPLMDGQVFQSRWLPGVRGERRGMRTCESSAIIPPHRGRGAR